MLLATMIWYMNCSVFVAMESPTFFQSCFAWMANFMMSASLSAKSMKIAGVCSAAFAHSTIVSGSLLVAATMASTNARIASQPLARRSFCKGGAKPPATQDLLTTIVIGVSAGIGLGPWSKNCLRKWSIAPWLSGIPGTANRAMSNQNRFNMHLYSGRAVLLRMHFSKSSVQKGCAVAPPSPILRGHAFWSAAPYALISPANSSRNFAWYRASSARFTSTISSVSCAGPLGMVLAMAGAAGAKLRSPSGAWPPAVLGVALGGIAVGQTRGSTTAGQTRRACKPKP